MKSLMIENALAMRKLHSMAAYFVSRNGQELGSFEAPQLLEGLQSGAFQPTDWLWQDGMSDWKTLADVFPQAAKPSPAPVRGGAPVRAVVPRGGAPAPAAAQRGASRPNPYETPAATATAAPAKSGGMVPQTTLAELAGTRPWVLLVAVVMWIGAGLSLVGVGLVFFGGMAAANAAAVSGSGGATGGVILSTLMMLVATGLIVYPTLKLTQYGTGITKLLKTRSVADLDAVLSEQRRFWKFYGIMILGYIVMTLIAVALAVTGAMMLMPSMAK